MANYQNNNNRGGQFVGQQQPYGQAKNEPAPVFIPPVFGLSDLEKLPSVIRWNKVDVATETTTRSAMCGVEEEQVKGPSIGQIVNWDIRSTDRKLARNEKGQEAKIPNGVLVLCGPKVLGEEHMFLNHLGSPIGSEACALFTPVGIIVVQTTNKETGMPEFWNNGQKKWTAHVHGVLWQKEGGILLDLICKDQKYIEVQRAIASLTNGWSEKRTQYGEHTVNLFCLKIEKGRGFFSPSIVGTTTQEWIKTPKEKFDLIQQIVPVLEQYAVAYKKAEIAARAAKVTRSQQYPMPYPGQMQGYGQYPGQQPYPGQMQGYGQHPAPVQGQPTQTPDWANNS